MTVTPDGYITLSDFAKRCGKTYNAMRQLVIRGVVLTEKIDGRLYVKADTAPPKDGRITSGLYRDWRTEPKKYLNKNIAPQE